MTPKSDHDMIADIHGVIFGVNGQGGLLRQFEEHRKEDKDFREGYYAFRLAVIVTGALTIGGSGFGFAKLLELIGR